MKLFYLFVFLPVINAFPMLRNLQNDNDNGCVIIDDHIDCIINKPYGPTPRDYNECGNNCIPLPSDNSTIQHNGVTYNVKNCFVKNGRVNCKIV